jgi:hypothetical protein
MHRREEVVNDIVVQGAKKLLDLTSVASVEVVENHLTMPV